MSDTANNADPAAAQKNAEGVTDTSKKADGQGEQKPEYLTKADAEALVTTALEKQRNAIFAEMRRNSKTEKSESKDDGQQQVTLASLKAKLDETEKRSADRDRRATAKIARAAYKAELIASGINQFQAQDLADSFVSKNLDAIRLGDDDSVHIVEAEGADPKPITGVVQGWLKTDHGKSYIQPKKTPSVELGKGGQGGGGKGEHPFSKLTGKQIMDHPDFSAREIYQRDFPEEWAEKKKGLFAPK